MESINCLIGCIIFIISLSIISGALWVLFLETKFGTLNKRRIIISIILGILGPIGLSALFIISIVSLFIDIIKNN